MFCFCSYLLYITQLINNQEMKPHQYSVYIKSVTMHPVPAFNKARYGRFEFSLGIFRYFPRFEFSLGIYRYIVRFEFPLRIYLYILRFEFPLGIYRYILSFEFPLGIYRYILHFEFPLGIYRYILRFPGNIPVHPLIFPGKLIIIIIIIYQLYSAYLHVLINSALQSYV